MGFSGFDFREIDDLAKTLEKYVDTPGFAKACRDSLEQGRDILYNKEKIAMQEAKGIYHYGITPPELVKSKVFRIKKGKNKGNYQANIGFNWGDNNYEVYKFYHSLENGYRYNKEGNKVVLDTPKEHLLDDNLEKNKNNIASVMENILKEKIK